MLGSTAGRLTASLLWHILVFSGLFYLMVFVATKTKTLTGANADEVALLVVLMTMVGWLVGVGFGSEAHTWKASKFWKHLCAVAVTLSVIIGAQKLDFGPVTDMSVLFDSAVEYYTSFFGFGLLVLASVAMFRYVFLMKSGEPILETPVAVIAIGAFATMLFSMMGIWALGALLLGILGIAAANVGELDDLPDGVSSMEARRAG